MKLLAIDGNSILNRSFYGVRGLSNSKGMPTNAIFGFLNMLDKMMAETQPDMVAVAFDRSEPTFRHQQFDGYKANRHGMPEDLAVQLPIAKQLMDALGYHVLECPGFEADDIMGTFARLCREQKVDCVISSGDRDNLQLAGDGVTVRLATNKEAIFYDAEKVKEQYGVTPAELVEVKALMGDSSDNIPGVKGIGEKTALSLISKYHTIDSIFEHIPELDATTRVKNLLGGDTARQMAEMSRELGKIVDNAPIDEDLNAYLVQPQNKEELYRILSELELKKFIEKYGLSGERRTETSAVTEQAIQYEILQNPSLESAKELLQKAGQIDFLYEQARLLIAVNDKILEYTFGAEQAFSELVLQSSLPKRTHDVKTIYHVASSIGEELENIVFSTDLAAYLLDALAKSYDLPILMEKYLTKAISVKEQYQEIAAFPLLCDTMKELLEQKGMAKLLAEIELPLSRVLASMEIEGFQVDVQGVRQFGEMLQLEIDQLTAEIHDMAGEEFNINSPKELGRILFDKLQLPTGKKTKTGYSTNVDVLEKLSAYHPIANAVLEYRKLTKLNSTYVAGLLKVTGADHRVHSVFKQTETRTGRISSTEPNMQNIPIRTELGREMRRFFTAKEGYVLLDADYSQIELRVLAHIANDQKMIEGFLHNADIHTMTAAQVFHLPPEMVTSEMRRRAKAINFGIVYGIGAFSLSQDIHVSVAEAREYINSYLNTYPGVKQYMEQIVEQSAKTGNVTTMFGRVRELPEIQSSNKNIRAFGERVALNTPIQGTAADIIKIAMVRVYESLKQERLDARLILQVHDELLIESSIQDAPRAKEILKQQMEQAVSLSVPMKVDVAEGKTWYDAKD